ncbi:MAG: thioredoxin-dependent peroxiredoxin [Candidatus Cloacimonadota bacterium]|jgi:peroxiredoxin Q/BCP|nr:thioredoxin-dependent peroxiredoxin [Candidatus Cloacimonadota bacterium]
MAKLEQNDKAPEFTLQNQDGEEVKLSDFKGKWLVLYFYPKDNTPGCTLEAKDFTCLVDEFQKLGVQVVGVSKDSVKSHVNFISKQELNLELLSDPDTKVMQKYGVWQPKKMFGKEVMGPVRSTFIIDPQGKIYKAMYKVKAQGHADKVLEILKEEIK